jgi:hypothetical protein
MLNAPEPATAGGIRQMNATADMLQLIWPLVFLLIMLFVLRQVRDDVNPIFKSVVGGLTQDAGRNAKQYAIAIGFGLSASLSAFVDVFKELDAAGVSALGWHQYAALWAKCLNPFIVAVLAYATQSSFKPANGNGNGTNPPL